MLHFCCLLHCNFERAISKIQGKRYSELTEEENQAFSMLKLNAPTETRDAATTSVPDRSYKRCHVGASGQTRYMDASFLLATSNFFESLFSKARFALNDRRNSILPYNFEEKLFIHINNS